MGTLSPNAWAMPPWEFSAPGPPWVMTTPNFFVVGAPKTGTTSLYHYLDQHPAVYMSPIKEPCFFAPEVVALVPHAREIFMNDASALQAYLDGPVREKRQSGIVLEWEQYLKLFKNVRDETAVGEASVSYLASSGAPRLIRARVPHARIIMMLRDPVDRLFSHFAALQAVGETQRTFVLWATEQARAETARSTSAGPVWPGRYARHLQRYLECFSKDQVRVYLYEDYAEAPGKVLQNLLSFLGVDPDYPVDVRRRHNVTWVPRWPAIHRRVARFVRPAARAIVPGGIVRCARGWYLTPRRFGPTADERAQVIEIYEEDIRALQILLGRDLSGWLDPKSAGRTR